MTGFPMSMPIAGIGLYSWKPIHSFHGKRITGSVNLKLKADNKQADKTTELPKNK
jgi:hypothetical protein